MQIIRSQDLEFIPASHEDPQDPGVLKKVLCRKDHLINGRVQMINWAKMPVGKAFARHFHQDMQEVFLILTGAVEISIDDESERLGVGDAVLIPIKAEHEMKNISNQPVEYIALGVSAEGIGHTVNV